MKLQQKLDSWVTRGLITDDQARAIAEVELNSAPRNWGLWTITGLGVLIILTGVISVVAANWGGITSGVKLAVYFVLQMALGAIAFRAAPGLLREACLTAFCLLVLAGIALIGQIFNLRSDGWSGLFFWLVLVLPPTLLAQSRLINHTWFIGLGITVVLWMNAGTSYLQWPNRFAAAMGVGFLCLAIGWFRPNPFPPLFARAALQWAIITLLWVATIVVNILCCGHGKAIDASDWGLVVLGASVLAAELALFVGWSSRNKRAVIAAAIAVAILAIGLVLPMLYPFRSALAGCLFFIATWAASGAAAAFDGRRRLFETAAAVIAIRIIVVYFEVFGSLAATGLGLIISGGAILAIAAAWHKLRKPMLKWLEGK